MLLLVEKKLKLLLLFNVCKEKIEEFVKLINFYL